MKKNKIFQYFNTKELNQGKSKVDPNIYLSGILQSIIELPGDTMIFALDREFRYITFNNNYKKHVYINYGKGLQIGDSWIELVKNNDDFDKKKRNIEWALAGEEVSQIDDYGNNSKPILYEYQYKPIIDQDKKILGIIAFSTNITERTRSEKTWAILLQISENVHSSENLEDLISKIRDELSKLIDTTNFNVALYDDDTDKYTFPYYVDQLDNVSKIDAIPLKRSLTDYVRKTGMPLLLSDNPNRSLYEKSEVELLGTPPPSWLGVPLKTGGRTIGVMVIQSYNKAGLYTSKDLELMEFVSDHIATAVERKRSEQKLKESAASLKIVQAIANIGDWELDIQTNRFTASEETFRVFGFKNVGPVVPIKLLLKIIHPDDIKRLKEKFKSVSIQNFTFDEEFKFNRLHDDEFSVAHAKAELKVNKDGKFSKVVGTIQDVTKYYLVQQELKRAKEKAEESDKLKSAFLANMSHEIRTPMNAILGFTRLLTNPELSINQREEYQEYISNSGNNLLNLINDIIDVAKIEAGQITVKKTNCPINKILNELYATYDKQKHAMGKSHIELILKRPVTDINFTIYSDPFRFRQIVANLIGNALKFIENGQIEFGFLFSNEKILHFFVKDTGIGIPEDKMGLIFSRFGQIQGTKIKNPGGTGLGLSISKHLVELLGGEIWVKSTLDEGTTFSFSHPYEQVEKVEDLNQQTDTSKEKSSIKGKRILIVEDNPINMKLVFDTLRMHDKKIIIDKAEDGKMALELVRRIDYDIIIMDIRMPVMDGYQTTEYIRTRFPPPKNKIPILGLSAHAMKEEKEKTEAIGMNAFLSKPFIPEELISKINELTETPIFTEIISKPEVVQVTLQNKLLDLSLLTGMYKGAQDKINNILNLCLINVPKQINDLVKRNDEKNWAALKVVAHSLKSNMNYLGLKELHELFRSIELDAGEKNNLDDIPNRISKINEIWKNAALELQEILGRK